MQRRNARKMTIESLLEYWAAWRAKRAENGLGYKASRLNMMMGSGVLMPSAGYKPELPYGIDADSLAASVDLEVCRLTARQKEVVVAEYCTIGTQEAKARGVGRGISRWTYIEHLEAAQTRLKMSPSLARFFS